MHRQYSFNSYF